MLKYLIQTKRVKKFVNMWLNSHVLEIKSLPWQVQEEEGDGRADEDDGQVALLGGQG